MRAAKQMTRDWTFWAYLAMFTMMSCSVVYLIRQHDEQVEAHRRAQQTIDLIMTRNADSDREHRRLEREIRHIESGKR